MADLLWEKRGLYGVYQNRGDKSFNEGGPASHRKILGLPSFDLITDIIHQILIGASSSTDGENGHAKVGFYAVHGGEANDARHLILYTSRSERREPSFRRFKSIKSIKRFSLIKNCISRIYSFLHMFIQQILHH